MRRMMRRRALAASAGIVDGRVIVASIQILPNLIIMMPNEVVNEALREPSIQRRRYYTPYPAATSSVVALVLACPRRRPARKTEIEGTEVHFSERLGSRGRPV